MNAPHITAVRDLVSRFDPNGDSRYFLFGSSVRKEKFRDIDLAVTGRPSSAKLGELREQFYKSRIPYKVDVVDFDAADSEFKEYVTQHEPIVWIR